MLILKMSELFYVLSIFSVFITVGNTLECYICKDQDGNFDKCVKTVQVCKEEQTWCLSEVKWGSLPYWQQGADKMFYINKSCSTKELCEKTIQEKLPRCDRIWYNDWECAECCQGDRCNYYVTLGAETFHVHIGALLICSLVTILSWLSQQ